MSKFNLENSNNEEISSNNNYISCIKMNGIPILPPVMTEQKRVEMAYFKQLAIEVENRIKQLKTIIQEEDNNKTQSVIYQNTDPLDEISFSDCYSDVVHMLRDTSPQVPCNIDRTNNEENKIDAKQCDVNQTNENDVPFESITIDNLDKKNENDSSSKLSRQGSYTIDIDDRVFPIEIHENFSTFSEDSGLPNSLNESAVMSTDNVKNETNKDKPMLIRQNSYTLDTPSPMLLALIKNQSASKISNELDECDSEIEQIFPRKKTTDVKNVSLNKQSNNICKSLPSSTSTSPAKSMFEYYKSSENVSKITPVKNKIPKWKYASPTTKNSVKKNSMQKWQTPYKKSPNKTIKYSKSCDKISNEKTSLNLTEIQKLHLEIPKKVQKEDDVQILQIQNFFETESEIPVKDQLNMSKTINKKNICSTTFISDSTLKEIEINLSPQNDCNVLNGHENVTKLKDVESKEISNMMKNSQDNIKQMFTKIQEQHSRQMADLVERHKQEQDNLVKYFNEQQQLLMQQIRESFPGIIDTPASKDILTDVDKLELESVDHNKSGSKNNNAIENINIPILITDKEEFYDAQQFVNRNRNNTDRTVTLSPIETFNSEQYSGRSSSVTVPYVHDSSNEIPDTPIFETNYLLNIQNDGHIVAQENQNIYTKTVERIIDSDCNQITHEEISIVYGQNNNDKIICDISEQDFYGGMPPKEIVNEIFSMNYSTSKEPRSEFAMLCVPDINNGVINLNNINCERRAKVNRQLFQQLIHVDSRKLNAVIVLQAAVRGWLVRRLFATERVQGLIQTVRDTLLCAMELHCEDFDLIQPSDVELHRRLIQQLTAACYEIHAIFFSTSKREQLSIISLDRQRKKDRLLRPLSARSSPSLTSTTQKFLQRKQNQNKSLNKTSTSAQSTCKRERAKSVGSTIYQTSHQTLRHSGINSSNKKPWR